MINDALLLVIVFVFIVGVVPFSCVVLVSVCDWVVVELGIVFSNPVVIFRCRVRCPGSISNLKVLPTFQCLFFMSGLQIIFKIHAQCPAYISIFKLPHIFPTCIRIFILQLATSVFNSTFNFKYPTSRSSLICHLQSPIAVEAI